MSGMKKMRRLRQRLSKEQKRSRDDKIAARAAERARPKVYEKGGGPTR